MDTNLAFEESSFFFPSFPSLEGKKIGVFYSGGMDSQVVSATLLKKGYDITLITVNNGAIKDINTPRKAAEYLYNLDCEGKVLDHVFLSSFSIFQNMVIRKLSEDIAKYGKDYSCVGCKLGMLAVAIFYAKSKGINVFLDGFVKAQNFYPEQTNAYISFVNRICKENEIEHYSPIYELSDKEQVKKIAITLGVPARSIDSSCLFEERPLQVSEEEVDDYLKNKESSVKEHIRLLCDLQNK
jgi:7-cyano-7-deazaguanine synthase in queuosine biosynthesis